MALEKLQILHYLYISDRYLKISVIEKKKLSYIYHTMLESNCNSVITSKQFTAISSIWHTNTTRTKFALVSCTNRNSYPKEKVSQLKGVSAVAAAGRKAEQNVRKASGGQECPSRLETLLQGKDRKVTPI